MKLSFEEFLTNGSHPNLVVIYPGRFQPAHKNHAKVFKYLVEKFPYASVFISTSNKVDLPKSPFTFEEKKVMLSAAGVPEASIVQTSNPYVAIEITKQFDSSNTKVIFAVGGKDMQTEDGQKPRFNFLPTKRGDAYFKPLGKIAETDTTIIKDLLPLSSHGYVATTPTFNFSIKIGGQRVSIEGASQIRSLYRTASDNGKTEIITQLYGTFNEVIYNIFNKRLL